MNYKYYLGEKSGPVKPYQPDRLLEKAHKRKRCCKVKCICVNRCLRFDQCVGVDPAQFYSTLYGGYYTAVLTVFTVLVIKSKFNISNYQEKNLCFLDFKLSHLCHRRFISQIG